LLAPTRRGYLRGAGDLRRRPLPGSRRRRPSPSLSAWVPSQHSQARVGSLGTTLTSHRGTYGRWATSGARCAAMRSYAKAPCAALAERSGLPPRQLCRRFRLRIPRTLLLRIPYERLARPVTPRRRCQPRCLLVHSVGRRYPRRRRSFGKERIAGHRDVEVAQRPERPFCPVSKRRRRAGSGTQAGHSRSREAITRRAPRGPPAIRVRGLRVPLRGP
jgi:hypothetical protein